MIKAEIVSGGLCYNDVPECPILLLHQHRPKAEAFHSIPVPSEFPDLPNGKF
jgi:hypothetical protein